MKNKSINQTNLQFELFLNLLFAPALYSICNHLPEGNGRIFFSAVFLAIWLGANIFLIRKNKSKGGARVFYLLRVAGLFLIAFLSFLFLLYI